MIYIVVAIALVLAYWLFSELFGYAKDAWEEWTQQAGNNSEKLKQQVGNDEVIETKPRFLATEETRKIDDLTRLYGLGPESEKALRNAGITSFRQLANTEVAQLEEIISEFSVLVSPESWPAQANIAARGDWDAFEEMYENLRNQEIVRRQVSKI